MLRELLFISVVVLLSTRLGRNYVAFVLTALLLSLMLGRVPLPDLTNVINEDAQHTWQREHPQP